MSAPEKLKILVKRPGEKSELVEVENDPTFYIPFMGQHTEFIPFPNTEDETIDLIVNESGILDGFEPNVTAPEYDETYYGTVIVAGHDGENTVSLTEKQFLDAAEYLDSHNAESASEKNESNKISAVIKEPGKNPYTKAIVDELDTYQKLVGGYIETVPFPGLKDVVIVLNEEGKLDRLDPNFHVPDYDDLIVGTVAIVGINRKEGDFVGLTKEQAEKATKYICENNANGFDGDIEDFIRVKFSVYDSDEAFQRALLGESEQNISHSHVPVFRIFQLNDKNQDMLFEPYSTHEKNGTTPNWNNYDLKYSDDLEAGTTLEDIYTRFNIDKPSGFKGHSLSISDVVVICNPGETTAHYVDTFGFKEVPEFFDDLPASAKDKDMEM